MADIQFNLRIPSELKEQIMLSAKHNNRSINSEAQSRLEQSFEYDSALPTIFKDQVINSLDSLKNIEKFLSIIKNLQEQVEKQNQLLEKLSETEKSK
ncbi:Arc family DNA-binding protein [Acinetobacter sp. B10A]|nr:Arc family DNA-binding protein [Acinetobacter baretiae]